MAKKVFSFFFMTLLLFFISVAAQAQNTAENPLNKFEKTANNLKNIESLPVIKEVNSIALTVKDISAGYQYIKSRIAGAIDYYQKNIQTLKESLEKIKNDGLRIKKYIEDKINTIFKSYKTDLSLA